MLTPAEFKITSSTLSARLTWLRKALDDGKLDKAQREDHLESCKLIESALQKLTRLADSSPKSTAASASSLWKRKGLKVLLAEDNSESATLVSELLQDLGIRDIELATSGVDAFDKIKSAKEPYDLILCDWDMPELSGLEVHNKARASNTLRGAHFMMVTAVSEASRIREAIQHGVSDYLVKPIDLETLEGKIKAAVGDRMPSPDKAEEKSSETKKQV